MLGAVYDPSHEKVLTCQRIGRRTTPTQHQVNTNGQSSCGTGPGRWSMYAEERQQTIAGLVADRGRVSVTALAEEFGVTTETVRRDLAVLERAGMLRRVHGGAVPAGALTYVETALGERHATRSEHKRKIAAAALDLLPGPDGSLLLDGGSSTAALAEVLPVDRRLLVATHSVP